MWGGLLIEYHTYDGCAWLGVGYGVGRLAVGLKNRRRLILDNQQLYVQACMQVDQARMISITCARL